MVTTSKGPVRGTTQYVDGKKKVDVFLGIPYAKPPLDNQGFTALARACLEYNNIMVKELVQKGAHLETIDNEGRRPIHLAASVNSYMCLEALLKGNALKNSQTSKGKTALFIASENGYIESTQVLLKYDVDPDICDITSKSPLEIAQIRYPDVGQLIRQYITGTSPAQNALKHGM
uniref:Carboxylesterase type B domain-containing protein n=1 Tax=Biomphalaria glabrata TaxID=6526 RepID=A0A2C9JKE5_BIOGL